MTVAGSCKCGRQAKGLSSASSSGCGRLNAGDSTAMTTAFTSVVGA